MVVMKRRPALRQLNNAQASLRPAGELLDLLGALGADGPLAPHLLAELAIGRLGTSREEGRHGFAVSELNGTSRL
jgi:hypothetical protein